MSPPLKTKPSTAPATDGRPLSAVARHVVAPSGIESTGWPRVRDTCHRLGWGFDGWQDGAGRLILGKRSDGLFASDTICISIPRQAGKTYLIACIIFALCLLQPGLTVIWTAHRKSTARETFDQFDGMAQRPKVAAHVRQVLRGKGDEAIHFGNGSRILFGARESGFGRGFAGVDILVCDEGQILPESTLEDLGATQNTAPNPLFFVMGTPPRPRDAGEFFTLTRDEALSGDSEETLYIETSADRGADPADRGQWRRANPSFPHRTSERAMLRLKKKLKNPDSWNREALGIWDEMQRTPAVIPPQLWSDLQDIGPAEDVAPDALAVDMSHDRVTAVAACWLVGDGSHIELLAVDTDSDPGSVVEWVAEKAGRRIPVVIDGMSPAASLRPALEAKKVKVKQSTAGDMAKACGLLFDDATHSRITHAAQEQLDEALASAKKRAIGKAGGWGWDRNDPEANIAPLVAATLARFGAEPARRRAARNGESVFR